MAIAPAEIVERYGYRMVASKGEAAGRLTGFSHLVFVTNDMDATVRFYRDILGLRVIGTSGGSAIRYRDQKDLEMMGERAVKRPFTRQYFFQLPNGEGFGFYEMPDSPDAREKMAPLGYHYWPDSDKVDAPTFFNKIDHISFRVDSREDIDWFMDRFKEHGVPFLGPYMPKEGQPGHFVYRLYLYDPTGTPLEIAVNESESDNLADFFTDDEPVPSLLEE